MGLHQFGVGTGAVSGKEEARCTRIAKKHDARFMTVDLPQPRFWFETKNRGEPFDRQVASAVMAEVGRVKTKSEP